MATNVLLPLSGSSLGRDGGSLNGKPPLRARQRNRESGINPSPAQTGPAASGFPGTVTRRSTKGEVASRPPPKHKTTRGAVTHEIDPSRYLYMNDTKIMGLVLFA